MNNYLAKWIDPRFYPRMEAVAELPSGRLAEIAPDGEYLMNIVKHVSDEERAAMVEFAENL